jgi:DNA-binding MurR/RpiR family transcriptional regulator
LATPVESRQAKTGRASRPVTKRLAPYGDAAQKPATLLSQALLAERSGVSRPTINRLEQGQDARYLTIQKLAAALGVEPAALVRDQ